MYFCTATCNSAICTKKTFQSTVKFLSGVWTIITAEQQSRSRWLASSRCWSVGRCFLSTFASARKAGMEGKVCVQSRSDCRCQLRCSYVTSYHSGRVFLHISSSLWHCLPVLLFWENTWWKWKICMLVKDKKRDRFTVEIAWRTNVPSRLKGIDRGVEGVSVCVCLCTPSRRSRCCHYRGVYHSYRSNGTMNARLTVQ